jgi:nucleoid-associated protein EbfC
MSKFMMRQAQELQARLAKAQQELGETTVEASAGGGAVKVVMDGHQKVRSVEIAPEVIDPAEREILQDMVMAAVNEAGQKAQELAAKQLGSLTGGLKIPGLT